MKRIKLIEKLNISGPMSIQNHTGNCIKKEECILTMMFNRYTYSWNFDIIIKSYVCVCVWSNVIQSLIIIIIIKRVKKEIYREIEREEKKKKKKKKKKKTPHLDKSK